MFICVVFQESPPVLPVPLTALTTPQKEIEPVPAAGAVQEKESI